MKVLDFVLLLMLVGNEYHKSEEDLEPPGIFEFELTKLQSELLVSKLNTQWAFSIPMEKCFCIYLQSEALFKLLELGKRHKEHSINQLCKTNSTHLH